MGGEGAGLALGRPVPDETGGAVRYVPPPFPGRMRSLQTTFRPQAKKYRAVNILSLDGETKGERSRSPLLLVNSDG